MQCTYVFVYRAKKNIYLNILTTATRKNMNKCMRTKKNIEKMNQCNRVYYFLCVHCPTQHSIAEHYCLPTLAFLILTA